MLLLNKTTKTTVQKTKTFKKKTADGRGGLNLSWTIIVITIVFECRWDKNLLKYKH